MKTPLKVLIVEDSKDDAELLLHALRHAGYEPSAAGRKMFARKTVPSRMVAGTSNSTLI